MAQAVSKRSIILCELTDVVAVPIYTVVLNRTAKILAY